MFNQRLIFLPNKQTKNGRRLVPVFENKSKIKKQTAEAVAFAVLFDGFIKSIFKNIERKTFHVTKFLVSFRQQILIDVDVVKGDNL